MFKLNLTSEKCYLLFKLWRAYFELPAKLIEIMNRCSESPVFKCELCEQVFAIYELLAFHYLKCDNKTFDSDWSCKLCDFKADLNLLTLLKHLIENHLNEMHEVSTELFESLITKCSNKNGDEEDLPDVPFVMIDTEQFHKHNFSEPAFKELLFDEKSISFLNDEKEFDHYLPERKCSSKFKFKLLKDEKKKKPDNDSDQNMDENNQQQTSSNDWRTLNLFESINTKHHITIYTGGPIYSSAWCPFPNNANFDQILCLATNVKGKIFNVFDCSQQTGVLQFWNFGKLNYNKNYQEEDKKPKLEFMIAHNYGTILEMCWCPGGTSFALNKNGRLGLLALACSDGYIRILSIPLIENLSVLVASSDDELKVFKCKPTFILDEHPVGQSLFNKQTTICKSISWSLTDQQRFIAAAYGNGLISIFDLQTNSRLLKKVQKNSGIIELKAKKSWIGHGAAINTIKWLPLTNCTYLVTGSFDRYVKIWCLDDMSMCFIKVI